MNIVLTKITAKDSWKFIKVIRNQFVKETLYIYPPKSQSKKSIKASFFSYLKNWSDFFFLIEVDGKFAGIIYIAEYFYHKNQKLDYDFNKASLTFALLPFFWNKGIGTMAVNKIIQIYIHSTNPKPLFADVMKRNPASCSILLKNNFKIIQETDKYYLFQYCN